MCAIMLSEVVLSSTRDIASFLPLRMNIVLHSFVQRPSTLGMLSAFLAGPAVSPTRGLVSILLSPSSVISSPICARQLVL